MDSPYDIKHWAANTSLGRRLFNHGYRVWPAQFQDWTLVKTRSLAVSRTTNETIYLWKSTGGSPNALVRISIVEHHDWRRAQRTLQSVLAHCTTPRLFPGTGPLFGVG